MKPKTPKWLDDIKSSGAFILDAVKGKTLQQYSADPVLRAAVERHFEIIGESAKRIADHDPQVAPRLGDYSNIIGFRNLLIHGYDVVSDQKVWKVIKNNLPSLLTRVSELLMESEAE